MCKIYLRKDQSKMSFAFSRTASGTLIDELAGLANDLIMREARGPGDYHNAMRRIEARYGIPYAKLWTLRFRRPKSFDFAVGLRIHYAAEHQCGAETEARSSLGQALLRGCASLRGLADRMDGPDDWPVIPG